ncbi:hypothetical protein IU449_17985 [Nocardia higoensis]|uniref:Uncharacterized protein n=1 Tax=Nocardia higoensis TaxID=228599 RepID=A0ABS0DD60_9NOCA|nr:hypothetical protein [Nocardia higoensis]MBF6356412.1 hypothetical protein [Nocardia higoensis]
MTSPENTSANPEPTEATAGKNPDVELIGYSVPPADDPDNPEEGPRGE